MHRDIQVWTIKDNYRLGSDINSKVLAFAFGLSAEIERNLISQRGQKKSRRCYSRSSKRKKIDENKTDWTGEKNKRTSR